MNNIPQLPPILDFNPDTNKGMLFDTRDGQSYRVVKIGNQIWLAENFRYLVLKEDELNSLDNFDFMKYGRFYDWYTASTIAPEGWRLSSNEDFLELKDFIIKDNNLDDASKVHSYLKSKDSWKSNQGIDKYGFSVFPMVQNNIYSCRLRSSTISNDGLSYVLHFCETSYFDLDLTSTENLFSVRLLKI